MSNKNSSKSGILTQFMEGGKNSGKHEQYIMADDSPSPDTPSTLTSPTISDDGSEKDADGNYIPETNLNVSALLLS